MIEEVKNRQYTMRVSRVNHADLSYIKSMKGYTTMDEAVGFLLDLWKESQGNQS